MDEVYNKRFLSNGERILNNFYRKRASLDTNFDDREEKGTNKEKALKWKLSKEYLKLLKENNHLRDFIKNYHVSVKKNTINSDLDKLKSSKKSENIKDIFDKLENKISKIFVYY